jgi:hypothetical protein
MTTSAVLAALLLAAGPAQGPKPAAAAAPPDQPIRPDASPGARPVHRGAGAVTYVTATRAYLDAGTEDGLAAGGEVALRRSGAPAGTCTIEAIAPHHAVCAGARARVGDTFELPAVAEAPPPKLLPPPPADDVLARRRLVLEAAPVPVVVFQASPAAKEVEPRVRAVDLAVNYQSWDTSPGGTSGKASLDILARGVPLASWLFLDFDGRLEHWTARDPNARFRPNDKTQFYLWQAQLTAMPSEAWSLSGGRVLPWGIPGATVFDGAMAGWHGRVRDTQTELGVFGGAVPEPDTTKPTGDRYTAGGYWVLDRRTGGVTLRSEGRLAAVHTPELGTRGEASLTGRMFMKTLDASAEVAAGAGGKVHAPSYIDAVRLDATFRPQGGLRLGGSFRYSGLEYPQTFDPAAFPGRSRQGDAFVSYDLVRWLRIGAVGGMSEDTDSKSTHDWFGPELTFPQVLWGRGTVSAGYLQESGTYGGQSAYAQLVGTPLRWLWLLGRAGWSHENTDGPVADEASLTLGARAELNKYLALRLTASGRSSLDGGGGPHALTGFATLQAGF